MTVKKTNYRITSPIGKTVIDYYMSQLQMAISVHNDRKQTGGADNDLQNYCIDSLMDFLKRLKK
jgi:hypothetical protein